MAFHIVIRKTFPDPQKTFLFISLNVEQSYIKSKIMKKQKSFAKLLTHMQKLILSLITDDKHLHLFFAVYFTPH